MSRIDVKSLSSFVIKEFKHNFSLYISYKIVNDKGTRCIYKVSLMYVLDHFEPCKTQVELGEKHEKIEREGIKSYLVCKIFCLFLYNPYLYTSYTLQNLNFTQSSSH